MNDVFLIRQAVRHDRADAVAKLLVEYLRERDADGPSTLLPAAGVSTASVFLERGSNGPALWWFVELDGSAAGPWTTPAAAVRQSPFFEARLDDVLAEVPDHVYGPGCPDGPLLLHARHPERPDRFRTGSDGRAEPTGQWAPRVLLAADGPADAPDVVLTRFRLRRGPATWFIRSLGWLIRWLDEEGWIERQFRERSEPVIEEEAMWAETVFFERRREGAVVLYWMECDDVDQVYEGFHASSSLLARVSEVALGWILEEPERALVRGGLTTDFESMVHAVDPDRR